ncbi:MAG: competence protein ComEA [Clostridiaceae bacterium]|jgi:competence protein ComEA|nr:competence protein ComEA [Clostridiaceae bacterium]
MNKRKNLDQQKRKKQNIILAFMLAVVVFALLASFLIGREKELDPEELTAVSKSSQPLASTVLVSTIAIFPVHVAGAVNNPGVFYFPEGVIVSDAIAKAGGPTKDAALEAINMASLLNPHAKLYVPTIEEVEAGEVEFSFDSSGDNQAVAASGKINLNLATETDLLTVPGIGPATAAAILKYREENGKFIQLEELMQVPGIKDKKFSSLEPYLYVP